MRSTQTLNRRTFGYYLKHVRPYQWVLTLELLGIIGSTACMSYQPILLKRFTDSLLHSSTASPREALVWIGIIILLGSLCFRIGHFANNFLVAKVKSDLLDTCFRHLHGHSHAFFNNAYVGSLPKQATRFSDAFEEVHDQVVWSITPTLITLTAAILIIGRNNPGLGMAILAWTVAYTAISYAFTKFMSPIYTRSSELDSQVSGRFADTLSNHPNLKQYGGVGREMGPFQELTRERYLVERKAWDYDSLAQGVTNLFMLALFLGMLYSAVTAWEQGRLTGGYVVLLLGYFEQIRSQLWNVGRYLHVIYEQLARAGQMTEILEQSHEIVSRPGAKPLTVHEGAIKFQDMEYGYVGEAPIFRNFNLTIEGGKRVAFVGTSGSGKSTLLKLLFRFMDVQKGKILIDGQDIAEVTVRSLRDALSLVPQEPLLFDRSIRENLRYAKLEATDEEVIAAAMAAHCHEFICGLPDRYDTLVGERGVKLSGGEKQRVAMARALLKDSPVLVLDEATSSLDSESESYIQEALAKLMAGRTTIVVAHRLSTVMQMDTIHVLHEGRIVESGSHSELLRIENGRYRKLWEIQVGGFMGG